MTRRLSLTLAFMALMPGLAQNESFIAGTVFAPRGVAGTVVIACYPSAGGCDEARSGHVEIRHSGTSAPYRLEGLSAGPYLLIAWQDGDGDGEMGEHELVFYQGGTEPSLITPPAEGIELRFGEAAPPGCAARPPSQLLGGWSQGSGSATQYYDPNSGAWAPPTGSGFSYTFYPDGRYEYSGMMQSSVYACTTTIFAYEAGTVLTEDRVMMLRQGVNKFKSQDTCNESWNYERDDPLETRYLLWSIDKDEYGSTVLEVTNLRLGGDGLLDIDPEYPEASIFYRGD
ncbi:hypothetical protein BH24DEI1_BH24DEI1_15690 [soil metagenome]